MTDSFFQKKYGYEINGVWMPRVTAVTSLLSKAEGIPRLEEYAAWGTEVHEGVGKLLCGMEVNEEERIAPAMRAVRSWLAEREVRIEDPEEDIERRVWDGEKRYAGTLDLALRINGVKGVADIKTGRTFRKEYALQTAAYTAAYNKLRSEDPAETRWILWVDQYQACEGCGAEARARTSRPTVSGGHPSCNHQWSPFQGQVELQQLDDLSHDLEAFLATKEVWEWYHRENLRNIPDYPLRIIQQTLIA